MFFLKNFLKRKGLIAEFARRAPISHIVSEDELKRAGNNLRNETFELAETLRAEMKSAADKEKDINKFLYKHVDDRFSTLLTQIREQQLTLNLILKQMGYKVTQIDQRTVLKLIGVPKKNSGRLKK